MDTRNKLEEANYFLEQILKLESSIPIKRKWFSYNLSAFLSAWKSVLDIMLYDFAEFYSMGLSRDDLIRPDVFCIVAKAKNNRKAMKFFKWWRKQQKKLSNNDLWRMRHLVVHRGYPNFTEIVCTPPSIGFGYALAYTLRKIPKEVDWLWLSDIPNSKTAKIEYTTIPRKCKEALAIMENIVSEAENEFNIKL